MACTAGFNASHVQTIEQINILLKSFKLIKLIGKTY